MPVLGLRRDPLGRTRGTKPAPAASRLRLNDGARVGVIGGGPAGSFVSYFLLDMAERAGIDLSVDIYEPRDFSGVGPPSCNHCGGIISESLVQILAAEGLELPPTVVQRGIDSYVLHTDAGSVRIETPLREKRIAAVFRGGGPRGSIEKERSCESFDGYLLSLAAARGANVIPSRAETVERKDDLIEIATRGGASRTYELVVGAVGVNSASVRLFELLGFGYERPGVTRTFILELPLGRDLIARHLGTSMHVFLLNLPRIEFAALIPKGDFVTVVLLGEAIDRELADVFLGSPEVKRCLPPGWTVPAGICHCSPFINVREAARPFADRIVLAGDCGAARLYKDGIGSAYRVAKTIAATAIMEGVSVADFQTHYWPTYRAIANDNRIGKIVFAITGLIQKRPYARAALVAIARNEQRDRRSRRRLSGVLWDTFTGSASYRDVFVRTLHPGFIAQFLWRSAIAALRK